MSIEIDNDNNEIRIDGYEYAGSKVSSKSYGISSESSQTGNSADLRLTGSDSSTDNVTFTGGTNVTVVRTDANKITISASANDTNTTYGISAETNVDPKSADIRLTGSDSTTDNITLVGGTNVTVTRTDVNTITLSSADTNTTYGISAETSQTGNSADLRLTGSNSTTDNVTISGGSGINISATNQDKITISNGGVTQFNGASGNISYNSFGTISDGTNIATADQANDTITFIPGSGIGVLVNGPGDSLTISNTGVTQTAGGTGISVSAGTGNVTINNTGVTAITAGTGITTSGSGNVTVTNDGVTTFNTVKGAITYNSFGTMSDGSISATADQANDTFTFIAGTGIGVLVNGPGDNLTISNTGVTSLNGSTGARYTYSTFTDGATPTTASAGNTTMTLTGLNGIKITTSPNTATVSMSETSKVAATFTVLTTATTNFFNVDSMIAGAAVEIRGVILFKFNAAGANNTINITLATGGTFTHAGVDIQLGAQNAEITSNIPGFTTAALNNTDVHTLWFSGVIVNGGTSATPSINITNNSGANTLDILAKSFIKYNSI